MKRTRRFLAWLLTMAMLISVLPANLFAEELTDPDMVMTEEGLPEESPDYYPEEEGYELQDTGDGYMPDPALEDGYTDGDPVSDEQEEIPQEDPDSPEGASLDEDQAYADADSGDDQNVYADDQAGAYDDPQAEESGADDSVPDEQISETLFTEEASYDTAQTQTMNAGAEAEGEPEETDPESDEILTRDAPQAEGFVWEGSEVSVIYDDGSVPAALAPQEGTTAVLDGDVISIHYVLPSETVDYAGLCLGSVSDGYFADEQNRPVPDFAVNEDGSLDFTLSADKAGFAHPVCAVRNDYTDGSWTDGAQYYLAVPPAEYLTAEEPEYIGNIVVSFEVYDAETQTVGLLYGPEKVGFTADDTGETIAERLLGAENVNISNGWINSFTIDGVEYTNTIFYDNGSWLVYRDNLNDGVGPADYSPSDGDVYRFVLSTYDAVTFEMPVFVNDMSALYWAVAETEQDKSSANALIQSAAPAQSDIDAMTASLSNAGGAHYIKIDGTTVQVNTTTYPYTYYSTLSADRVSAAAGETVTVNVTAPEGVELVEGSLTANGVPLTYVSDGVYSFVMPDAHVTVTARFEETYKLLSAVFSDDAAGLSVIPLDPAFSSDTYEYTVNTYDYIVEENGDNIYFTATFDEGAEAKWDYYMEYSGYGFYSDGPAVTSGVIYGHSSANMLYPGMTNGKKHRLDLTSPGGTVKQYYFTTTMLPTLESIAVNGEEIAEFDGNENEYTVDVTVPAGTTTVPVLAVPYDEDVYYVYLNDGGDDIAGTAVDVPVQTGENVVSLVVDDDEGTTFTYTLTINVEEEASARDDLNDLITEAEALDEEIVEGTEPGQYAEGTKAALETAIADAKAAAQDEDLTEEEAEAALLALQAAIKAAKAAQNPEEFEIFVIADYETDRLGYANRTMKVSALDAAEAGFTKPEEVQKKVTALDALVDVHRELYADFSENPSAYLAVADNGWITKVFGSETASVSYYVNDIEVWTLINETVLSKGDKLVFFTLDDNWLNRYLTFSEEEVTATAGKPFELTLGGRLSYSADGNTDLNLGDYTISVFAKNANAAEAAASAVTDAEGTASITIAEAGEYYATVTAARSDAAEQTQAFAAPYAEIIVEEDNSVPENLQLATLSMRAASGAAAAEYPLEPAFDPAVGEYTFYLPDSSSTAYAWASLAEGNEGDITFVYNNPSSGAAVNRKIGPSGNVNLTTLAASNSFVGQDVVVKIDGQEAYLLHVVRQATLATGTTYGLNIIPDGQTSVLALTPAYNRTVYEYDANIAADTVLNVKVRATVRASAALTVDGRTTPEDTVVTVTPAWNDHSYDLRVEVAGEGARTGEYVIHLHEASSELRIRKAPDKLVYTPGETFDPAGMEVQAVYPNGDTMDLTADDYTWSPAGPLTLADTTVTISYSGAEASQPISFNTSFEGSGTEEDPFQIATPEDMAALDAYVEGGESFAGTYLIVLNDITLADGWDGVGASGKPFGGDFDGNGKTLTIPSGGKAVFAFVRGAKVHDLNVFGEKIDDYGLVSIYTTDSGVSSVVEFDNVTLKSGTQTLYSGFMGGYASGTNLITIKNCTIEENVIVGYDRQQSNIGGFAGEFNGTIDNSTSSAAVYGVNYVGGLVANKGQSMGTFKVTGSTFSGSVAATGCYVGGIVGAGYGGTRWGMSSAWSTPGVTIENCISTGTVSGIRGVGGILGGEGAQSQAWESGSATYIRGNSFSGTVSGESFVGGTIGFILSLNRYSFIENNYYAAGCGASEGIGAVGGIDTSGVDTSAADENGMIGGVYYFNTSTQEGRTAAEIRAEVPGHPVENYIEIPTTSNAKTIASKGYANQFKVDHNRTDDPLGADKANLCRTDPVEKIEAAVAAYNAESGALRPSFKNGDTDITSFVEARLAASNEEWADIEVTLKSTGDTDWIGSDGTIHYNQGELNAYGMNSKNVSVVFTFTIGGASADTASRNATIGWDQEHYAQKMQSEADSLAVTAILGENTSADEITKDLSLPQIMTDSSRTAWSKITWTSSNESVIAITAGDQFDAVTTPKKGVVTVPSEDTVVTLTAVFAVNEANINTNVEPVSDFATVTKTFDVTVKGEYVEPVTEESLLEILNTYFPDTLLAYSNASDGELDPASVHGDIQLPRYTRIKDENNAFVFANREIAYSSNNTAAVVNGYRLAIDPFTADPAVTLTVSFTREGITVSKTIDLTIANITDDTLDAAVAMMDTAKAHYWDGLNDGAYADADSVTGNLHAFQEMNLDAEGKPVFAYSADEKTGAGIIPDSFWEAGHSEEMEASGYNRFKSSDPSVIQHENLVVNRPEASAQVTVTSWLSSAKYGVYAPKYPDNEKLQKLYKQEVTATVTVKGTKAAAAALNDLISEAEALDEQITEGTEPGQYAVGTKAALEAAIADAKDVAQKEDLTEEEAEAALQALQAAVKAAKDAQNPEEFEIFVIADYETDRLGYANRTLKVSSKDAAEAGFKKPEGAQNKVTALDALVDVHRELYAGFDEDPSAYLAVGDNGWITKVFGSETASVSYYVNDIEVWTLVNETVLAEGDKLVFFTLDDNWLNRYLTFSEEEVAATAGQPFELTLEGRLSYAEDGNTALNLEGYTVSVFAKNSNGAAAIESAVTDAEGKAVFVFAEAGEYYATVTAARSDENEKTQAFAAPYAEIIIEEDNSVPENLQLATLSMRAGSGAAAAEYPLEPAFDPAVGEYTFYLPDSSSSAYAWASLAEGNVGDITFEYRNPSSGASISKKIGTSGNVNLATLGASNSILGQDVVVKVGGQEAYLLHVVRQATLASNTTYGLNIIPSGQTAVLALTPAYNRTVYEYDANAAADAVLNVKVRATDRVSTTLTVDGRTTPEDTVVAVTPAWNDHIYDLRVEVAGEGARTGEYVIHLHEAPSELVITKAPNKVLYASGENFDPAGMEVQAVYSNGDTRDLTADDYTWSPAGPLRLADTTVTISYNGTEVGQQISFSTSLEGSGTEEDPFQIATPEDMATLDAYVEGGESFAGTYLKVLNDITLADGWGGVGASGKPFGGDFDGNGKTLTIPSGGKAVFTFVRGAKVHDLNVFGEKIDDYGLVSIYTTDSGVESVVEFDNVTLKSGTQTLYSGFIGGYASGTNLVTIKNCTIEENVIIGYDRQQSNIGGFAGEFNGTIENSTCSATVYGVNYVGGLVANKGQTMGTFKVTGGIFAGSVEATGCYVGGIVGAGYGGARWGMSSAWSTPGVTIENCTSTGTVSGTQGVGGILGGEGAQGQAWDNGPTYIRGNSFSGTVSGESFVGGTIGYILSLNKNSFIENNYYAAGCGAAEGIGAVGGIDTSGVDTSAADENGMIGGVYYFNTSTQEGRTLAEIRAEVPGHPVENYIDLPPTSNVKTIGSKGYASQLKGDHNRTDDPLGADKENLCYTDHVDFSAVDEALAAVPEDLSIYTEETRKAVEDAVAAVDRTVTSQDAADAMAAAITDAVNGLKIAVTGVKLNKTSLEMVKGDTETLKATVTPSNAADKTVTWKSSNPSVVSVDKNGKVSVNTAGKAGKATITVTTNDGHKTAECSVQVLFTDVPLTHSFQKAVYWAVEEGITGGMGTTGAFGVNETITRGQVVTFLWRAAGKPEPKKNTQTFKDVPTDHAFYKAIQWAAEKGITGGYTGSRAGLFGPNDPCTRGQIMTFIWRYAGKPNPKGNKQVFSDVPTTHSFYKAIQWASENGITAGYSDGTFGVDRSCTRGHCVTFLYRQLGR